MKRLKVSNNVIRRLPRYLRKLDELTEIGISRISSFELGHQLGLTPSQIRQDFSCFGEFGQQGYGYNVPALRAQIASILGMDRGFTAILVGVGNNYLLLQDISNGNIAIVDLYSVKYVYVYFNDPVFPGTPFTNGGR